MGNYRLLWKNVETLQFIVILQLKLGQFEYMSDRFQCNFPLNRYIRLKKKKKFLVESQQYIQTIIDRRDYSPAKDSDHSLCKTLLLDPDQIMAELGVN